MVLSQIPEFFVHELKRMGQILRFLMLFHRYSQFVCAIIQKGRSWQADKYFPDIGIDLWFLKWYGTPQYLYWFQRYQDLCLEYPCKYENTVCFSSEVVIENTRKQSVILDGLLT